MYKNKTNIIIVNHFKTDNIEDRKKSIEDLLIRVIKKSVNL